MQCVLHKTKSFKHHQKGPSMEERHAAAEHLALGRRETILAFFCPTRVLPQQTFLSNASPTVTGSNLTPILSNTMVLKEEISLRTELPKKKKQKFLLSRRRLLHSLDYPPITQKAPARPYHYINCCIHLLLGSKRGSPF